MFLLLLCSICSSILINEHIKENIFASNEFQVVNGLLDQRLPSVSVLNDGFVVVYNSDSGGAAGSIRGRIFNSTWDPITDEFIVVDSSGIWSTYYHDVPVVASNPDGSGFMVVWMVERFVGTAFDVAARLYDSSGNPLSSEQLINFGLADNQEFPFVAGRQGGYITVHHDYVGGNGNIVGRCYNNTHLIGPPFYINELQSNDQIHGSIITYLGGFVVVWDTRISSEWHVAARRFNSDCTPAGSEVALATIPEKYYASFNGVAKIYREGANDDILVVYENHGRSGDAADEGNIYGQFFDSNLNAVGNEIRINKGHFENSTQFYPSVCGFAEGGWAVIWNSHPNLGPESFIVGKVYDKDDVAIGEQFNVSVFHSLKQSNLASAISCFENGFVSVWSSFKQDIYDNNGIFSRVVEVREWDCFGVNRNNGSVCSSRGSCDYPGICNCVYPSTSDNCEEVYCYGLASGNGDVCSGEGNCVLDSYDVFPYTHCRCLNQYFGSKCEERIIRAYYVSTKVIEIMYFCEKSLITFESTISNSVPCQNHIMNHADLGNSATCSWIFNNNDISTRFVINTNRDYISQLEIRSITNTSEFYIVSVSPYINPIVLLLEGWWPYIVIGIGIAFVLLFFISILLFFIVLSVGLCFCNLKANKKLSTVKELDDVEIKTMIEEKKAAKEYNDLDFKINKDIFVINYDKVKLIKKIGDGGSNSNVFSATWEGNDVAFKVFKTIDIFKKEKNYASFELEVAIMSKLSHPNILQFFGASLKEPRVGIVMEFCKNGDLVNHISKMIRNEIDIPLEKRLALCFGIASGIAYLHTKNIIHRDIKSRNVLLTDSMVPKICDFGLSKLVKEMNELKTQRVGTSYYMAPEVTVGRVYTEKADVFSFAIVMWEIINLSFQPFELGNFNVEMRIANNPEFRPKFKDDLGLPLGLEKLIKKCWDDDPKERKSFEEIKSYLELIKQ